MPNAYEAGFLRLDDGQAALLRSGRRDAADIANVAEQIESRRRGERSELVNGSRPCCCIASWPE